MSITYMVYSFLVIFYSFMGLFTLNNDRKSKANQMFLVICMILSFWSLSLALMTTTNDPVIAAFYRRIMVIFWSSLWVQTLSFVLIITNRDDLYKKVWFKILIYIPALVCFCVYFFNPVPAEYMLRVNGAWVFRKPTEWGMFYEQYLFLYYSSYMIISIILLIIHSKKAKFIRNRKQARIIYISYIVVGLLATTTDVILPNMGYVRIPPLTPVLCFIAIVCVWYAIGKYSMMKLSSDKIQLDASKTMNEGLIIFDNNDQVVHFNNGAKKMLECKNENWSDIMQLDSIFPKEVFDMDDTTIGYESYLQTLSGRELPVIISKNTIKDNFGEKYGRSLYFQDITVIKKMREELQIEKGKLEIEVSKRTQLLNESNIKLKQEIEMRILKEKEIEKMAYTDHLTGLPNRRMFNEYLKREVKRAERTNVPFAMLFIDLDKFKVINDSLGHSCGDILLKRVSARLLKSLRSSDLVTRVGGDEFAILVFNPSDVNAIEAICINLIKQIEVPFNIQNTEVRISASIGVSVCPNDSCDPIQLLANADISMYEAKKSGPGKYSFYDITKSAGLEESMRLSNDLYRALEYNELEVYYQPQISAATKDIIGFEALVRWNHPKLGFLLPNQFIGIAERTELINSIGKWVFETACRQLKIWNATYHKNLRMAINISPKQLENSEISNEIIDIVEDIGIDPSLIELEITESVLVKDIKHTIKILTKIIEVGIHIAIDDFGSDYSAFRYIKNFPINRIKIPKSFIDGINEKKSDEAIVLSTIQLAKTLGMNVVAEGVEQGHQYQYLLEHDCDTIQGFLFFKPMSALNIEKELGNSKRNDDIEI